MHKQNKIPRTQKTPHFYKHLSFPIPLWDCEARELIWILINNYAITSAKIYHRTHKHKHSVTTPAEKYA